MFARAHERVRACVLCACIHVCMWFWVGKGGREICVSVSAIITIIFITLISLMFLVEFVLSLCGGNGSAFY